MPGGFDQYLAVHLASSSGFRVVTDPAQATLVLTDRIGEDLEQTLKDMGASPAETDKLSADSFARPNMRPLSRNRGTLFLVERASRQVLWSAFQEPKTSEPKELNRSAEKMVERLIASRK